MLTISTLTIENFIEEDFITFFQDYDLEKFYQLNLNIQSEKFYLFLTKKLKKRIESKNGSFWVIKNNKNIITAVFGLEEEINSSKYYHKSIYNLSSFYNFSSSHKEAFILIKKKIAECQKAFNIDYIKCKVDLADHKNISYLLDEHFHYYASSQKVYLDFDTYGYPHRIIKGRYKVRDYNEQTDLNECLVLIGQHNQNEKYYNQEFAVEQTQLIFEEWFRRQSNNDNSKTLVLYDASEDNKIIGLSIHSYPKQFNDSLELDLITWDIVVLDKNVRGSGLTNLLFSEIIFREKKNIEGSTMSDNLMLQKFVHKFGFFVVGTFIYLGKKYY